MKNVLHDLTNVDKAERELTHAGHN